MLTMDYANKAVSQPTAEIDALCQEIGQAEARGRKVPKLRKRLGSLLTSWEELEAEAKIQAAATAHARTVETEHELRDLGEALDELRRLYREVIGPEAHGAMKAVWGVWSKHEAAFGRMTALCRTRDVLNNRVRAHQMALDVPERVDFAAEMGIPDSALHPLRLLYLDFQRYRGRRPEIRESDHPGRRVFTPSGNASPPSALDTRQRSALERFLGK